jgi:colanic acid biosynthesis glycosyl transferase WcaI
MGIKQKVWIVSELYYPDLTSTGYILTQIAEGLSVDYEIHILCGQPRYSARGVRAPVIEKRNGVKIERCSGSTLNKNVLLFKVINFITLSFSMFLAALIKLRRNDIVLVVTNPPVLPYFVVIASKIRGSKCNLLIHDIYPDILVATGMMKENSLIVRILSIASSWLYRSVDSVFVIGRDMKMFVSEKVNNCKNNIVLATNWADIDLVKPELKEKNKLIDKLGIKSRFIVLYAGNMGYPNDVESIVLAAELLRENEEIVFLFIGDGVQKKWIENYSKIKKLKNIIILPSKPRSEQLDFLNACDLAIISLKKNMKGISVPSRLYNTMASGKPIVAIADKASELSMVVEEERIGWVVTPGEPYELLCTLNKAMNDRAKLEEMGLRSREIAEIKYSFQRILDIYRESFKKLL